MGLIKNKELKKINKQRITYSDEDFKILLDFLDSNDKNAAFFCRMIYYNCLRPSEIGSLKIQNIHLVKGAITIFEAVNKVTKKNGDEIITINESFKPFLEYQSINECPPGYYLAGSIINMVGDTDLA